MTLQPLVENCIYHGVKGRREIQGVITVTAQLTSEKVLVRVQDNGRGMEEEQVRRINETIHEFDARSGYGVRNVNKRLEILFGTEYGLHYESTLGQGTVVTIALPKGNIGTICMDFHAGCVETEKGVGENTDEGQNNE